MFISEALAEVKGPLINRVGISDLLIRDCEDDAAAHTSLREASDMDMLRGIFLVDIVNLRREFSWPSWAHLQRLGLQNCGVDDDRLQAIGQQCRSLKILLLDRNPIHTLRPLHSARTPLIVLSCRHCPVQTYSNYRHNAFTLIPTLVQLDRTYELPDAVLSDHISTNVPLPPNAFDNFEPTGNAFVLTRADGERLYQLRDRNERPAAGDAIGLNDPGQWVHPDAMFIEDSDDDDDDDDDDHDDDDDDDDDEEDDEDEDDEAEIDIEHSEGSDDGDEWTDVDEGDEENPAERPSDEQVRAMIRLMIASSQQRNAREQTLAFEEPVAFDPVDNTPDVSLFRMGAPVQWQQPTKTGHYQCANALVLDSDSNLHASVARHISRLDFFSRQETPITDVRLPGVPLGYAIHQRYLVCAHSNGAVTCDDLSGVETRVVALLSRELANSVTIVMVGDDRKVPVAFVASNDSCVYALSVPSLQRLGVVAGFRAPCNDVRVSPVDNVLCVAADCSEAFLVPFSVVHQDNGHHTIEFSPIRVLNPPLVVIAARGHARHHGDDDEAPRVRGSSQYCTWNCTGSRVATSCDHTRDASVVVWDAESGAVVASVRDRELPARFLAIAFAAWCPRTLFFADTKHTVYMWREEGATRSHDDTNDGTADMGFDLEPQHSLEKWPLRTVVAGRRPSRITGLVCSPDALFVSTLDSLYRRPFRSPHRSLCDLTIDFIHLHPHAFLEQRFDEFPLTHTVAQRLVTQSASESTASNV